MTDNVSGEWVSKTFNVDAARKSQNICVAFLVLYSSDLNYCEYFNALVNCNHK